MRRDSSDERVVWYREFVKVRSPSHPMCMVQEEEEEEEVEEEEVQEVRAPAWRIPVHCMVMQMHATEKSIQMLRPNLNVLSIASSSSSTCP